MRNTIINIFITIATLTTFVGSVNADSFPVPLNNSSVLQTLGGGFSVGALQAFKDASFEQDASFKGLWRGKIVGGFEKITFGKSTAPAINTNLKIKGKLNILSSLYLPSLVRDGTGGNLCVDTQNGGRLVKCPPDICYGGSVTQTTAGTYNFSLPRECPDTQVTVKIWGAGGSGAEGAYSNCDTCQVRGGGGGGGGGYTSYTFNLTKKSNPILPVSSIVYTVGAGGVSPNTGNLVAPGVQGGTSSAQLDGFLVAAYGGKGGGAAGVGPTGSGGEGGSTNGNGSISVNGINGGSSGVSSCRKGDPGGKGADALGMDGIGIIPNSGGVGGGEQCTDNRDGKDGLAGKIYGSGGGGGGGANPDFIGSNSGGKGRPGDDGKIIITW